MAQNGHANVADGEDIEAMHEENKRRLAQVAAVAYYAQT